MPEKRVDSKHARSRAHDGDDSIDAMIDAMIDPATRISTSLAPPAPPTTTSAPRPSPASTTVAEAARLAELATMASATVETAAFWGDGRRGVARLRFGSNARGGLADATVELEDDGVSLRLVVRGGDVEALAERLRRKGIDVE